MIVLINFPVALALGIFTGTMAAEKNKPLFILGIVACIANIATLAMK